VGRIQDPWRAADARVRSRPVDGLEIHGAGSEAAFSNLEDISSKSRWGDRRTAYRALIFRKTESDETEEPEFEFGLSNKITITEKRQYAFHRKIERNSTASRKAKKFHGTTCQACTLSFIDRYGKIGKGYIEAHHLKPIGKLKEGEKVEYDIASDFAVLCANCHRMIHRSDDPSDLNKFRSIVQSNKP
jgi:5-methylcytosine-specific restriction protein A